MANPAVAVIARWEWARRWRSLLVLGVACGLLGGLVVGGAVLARRTISAPDRLAEAVAPGDVHLRIFDAAVVDQATRLPEVAEAWVAGVGVGQIVGGEGLQYAGVIAPTATTGDGVVRPVVVRGRAADPANPDEVVVTEAVAEQFGLGAGDRLVLDMLSGAEVFQFDTGFGAPDGPTVALDVVGVVRVTPGLFEGSPIVATPAFAAAHPEVFAGYDVRLALRDGDRAADAVVEQVTALGVADADSSPNDFAPVAADRPRAATERLVHAAHVLFAGLIAAVVVAGLAVAAGLAQAWARHHSATAGAQQVESALGLTSGRRVLARAIPASASAAVAGVIAAGVGLSASWVQPVGSLWRSEPMPGWRPDLPAVVVGAAGVGLVALGLAAATAWRAGRVPATENATAVGRRLRLVPARGGWPLAGAAFALSRGGRRHVPVRMSLLGCVAGIAGLVGSVVFTASLDRLVATPARWGWNADLSVADTDDALLDTLVADPRLAAVADVASAESTIDGRDVDVYAVEPRSGEAGWVLQQGRLPTTADEVVLGARLARQLERRVGDTVTSGDTTLTVVGIGLGPPSNLEALGSSALLSPDGLRAVATTSPFREALVRLGPAPTSTRPRRLRGPRGRRAGRAAGGRATCPELGSLPALLGGFLALLAAVALVHALAVTRVGRAGDIAVLRALGATPRRSGMSIVAMSVTSVAVGLLGGVPLGFAVARLLWGEVARSIGVARRRGRALDGGAGRRRRAARRGRAGGGAGDPRRPRRAGPPVPCRLISRGRGPPRGRAARPGRAPPCAGSRGRRRRARRRGGRPARSVESRTTTTSGQAAAIRRAASMPSSTGMLMSIRTRSGVSSPTCVTAAAPSAALADQPNPAVRSTTARATARNRLLVVDRPARARRRPPSLRLARAGTSAPP